MSGFSLGTYTASGQTSQITVRLTVDIGVILHGRPLVVAGENEKSDENASQTLQNANHNVLDDSRNNQASGQEP